VQTACSRTLCLTCRRTLLHTAAGCNNAACVPLLAARGVSVSARSSAGTNCLTALHEACARNFTECAAALIAAGASVNATGKYGVTPAYLAAQCGSAECLELLAQHGANFAVTTEHGYSLLHAAAGCARAACVGLLLRYTPALPVDALSVAGATALNAAVRTDESVLNWLQYTGIPMPASLPEDRAACVHMLLHAGADITTAVLRAATTSASAGADALCQYMTTVRTTAASRGDLLTVHAQACSSTSTTIAAAAAVTSTAAASTGASSVTSDSAAAAAGAAAATAAGSDVVARSSEVIAVQLVHAVTGVKAAKQY
jgi:hypothetical protein